MADAFDIEAILEEQAAKTSTKGDVGSIDKKDQDSDRRDRDRGRDRSTERRRSSDRDRSRDRRRNSRDRERRRRSPDSRDRRRGGGSRRSRSRDRERSKGRDRDRSDRDRDERKPVDPEMEAKEKEEREIRRKEREQQVAAEREALRRQREIEDLTKDQRTIFVGQLVKKANERNLEDFFGQIGRVKNVIMLRDKFTTAHKGFAYVEMADLESIPNCLLFNNVIPDFQKFPIAVKASEAEKNFIAKREGAKEVVQPGAVLGSILPDTRVYVGNIHINIDEMSLQKVLEQFGPIESLKLHRDNMGNSKGFAFVKYISMDSANMAMAALPSIELAGRQLKVGPVTDNRTNAMLNADVSAAANVGSTDTSNWKLDADDSGGGGLSMDSTKRQQLMAKLGQAAGLVVPTMPVVTMAPTVPAVGPNGLPLPGKVEGNPSRFVLVSNMFDPATETDPNWDQDIREDVVEESSNFGRVEQCYVEKNKPGGLVFLKMATIDAAVKAAHALHGRYFAGRMITALFLDETRFNDLMR